MGRGRPCRASPAPVECSSHRCSTNQANQEELLLPLGEEALGLRKKGKELKLYNIYNFKWIWGQLKKMVREVAAFHFYVSRFIPV
ncbi:hypothetical protein AV530_002284 [Patagioenas fasciata monilis]|uniref:Uncharacterized protein n=1 Tax=Patagioenas fasciata monilis TaxID=372326 RepID=A0A1V4K7E0_PATFA|nr:hypothetical protein AV530_002284 [Patagioenas fasciata monilis]